MRVAVLADVHANLPALECVLEDIGLEGVDRVLHLGDLVGYNAHPLECVEQVRSGTDAGVMGNHDWNAIKGGTHAGTNEHARHVMTWTREVLDDDARGYLGSLPGCHVDASGVVLAHGCFLNDVFHRGYATSTMLEANLRAIASNPSWPATALCGHTHVPMCGYLQRGSVVEHDLREPVTWPARADAVLINPGSVGQPRDGDPRAAYVLMDMERHWVACRRVEYPVNRAVEAMRRARFPSELASRLWEGR
jgi:predicted phosphodiesterase